MSVISKSPKMLFLLAMLTGTMSAGLHAQQTPQAPQAPQDQAPAPANPDITVNGTVPADLSGMENGPEVEGFISARNDQKMLVTTPGGTKTLVLISDGTRIKSKGGLLGIRSNKLAADQLLNGLPVNIKTVQWGGGLVASQIALKTKDLRTASMIRNGTDQRFGEQAAATQELRGRVADIDQYNVKSTTN